MTAPLPSCLRHHPGVPSAIRLSHAVGSRGNPFMRRYCSVCRAIMDELRSVNTQRPVPLPDYGLALGVMRLSWSAPEHLP